MSIREKLLFLKQKEHLTTKEISKRSSIPVGTLNKILNGDTKSPSLSTIKKLAQTFDVTETFFMEESLSPEQSILAVSPKNQTFAVTETEQQLIENFRLCSKATQKQIEQVLSSLVSFQKRKTDYADLLLLPCLVLDSNQSETPLSLSEVLVVKDHLACKADFAVKLWDRSLEPIYHPGQVLAIQKGSVRNRCIGLFLYQQRAFLRKFTKRGSLLYLSALNRKIPPQKISAEEKLETLGTVLGPLHTIHRID